MLNLIFRYKIITNRSASVLAGNYINVYWDDVASGIEVQQFDDASDTSGTIITSGPDLGATRVDYDIVEGIVRPPGRGAPPDPPGTVYGSIYRFCSGTTLNNFSQKSLFPYANLVQHTSHFSCSSVVCDLTIGDDYTVQAASDFVTPDGVIEVTATSTNGDIKYSLDFAFDYSTQGQLSGLFPGLYAGEYTVTAKDAAGCVDQITITVPVPDFYNPLYRLEYTDQNNTPTRVDVLERGYEGSVTEVCGSDDPFVLKYEGDGEINKFTPIIPSTATLTLIAESNFFFRSLFTQDERKYQIKYYKNFGNSNPGFTPASLPAVNTWTNIPYVGPQFAGVDWGGGNPPFVTMTAFSFPRQSDLWHTAYTFETGQTYTFDYSINTSTAGGFSDVSGSVADVLIVDASYNVLTRKTLSLTANATASGTFVFVAPSGATGLAVQIKAQPSAFNVDFYITAFTNSTPSVPAGDAGYELKWIGYIISSNYSEAYLAPPYPVSIVATDGLADLKNYSFLDPDDNKFREDIISLDAVCSVVSKTDLGLNIVSSVNRYEESMSAGSTDDPLNQCKFNPATFYHNDNISNCYDVLAEILKPFGSRVLQRNGKWMICTVEEMVGEVGFREFNKDGVLITSGTIDDVVDIDYPIIESRAAFRDRAQVLSMIPAYGKLFFEHTLLKNASLVASYSFEPSDIYKDSSGLTQISNWNVNIASAPGATYGIKETKSLEGDFNFFLKYQISPGGGTNVASGVSLLSAPFTIEYESVDAFEYRFNYACLLSPGNFGAVYWVKLKWMLKIGSYYYNENGGWTTDVNQQYNDIIIERFNEVLEKKVTALLRNVDSLTNETVEVEFILQNAYVYDFVDIAALKATPTTTKSIGARMKVRSSNTLMHYYILQEGTDAESLPDIARPDDYAASTNERVWVAEHLSVASRGREVEYNYIDNVVLLHYPDGAEPPEDITIERNNNAGIKVNYEESYLLNDVDLENINNSERTYKNFFKKLDGTPTQVWERTYRAGSGKLLDLLSNDVVSQYKRGSNKLTGSFLVDTEVLPTSVMNEVNDDARKYMFMGYELHDKSATIAFDLLELIDTVTDTGGELDAGFTTGFSLGFRS